MNNNNFDFAIGIPSSITDISQCLKIIEESGFKNVEIPGIWVESTELPTLLHDSGLTIIGATDLIESSVSTSIADYNETIRNGFIEKMRILTNILENINIGRFTLNPGVDAVFTHPSKVLNRSTLMKYIAPDLYRKELKMNIPVRVPSVSEIKAGQYATFLRDTMCGNIKLAINIHPHEPLKSGTPSELLEEFKFFIDTISFVYEPETGNALVKQVVAPWLKTAAELDFVGPVIFRPRLSRTENMIETLTALSTLVKTL